MQVEGAKAQLWLLLGKRRYCLVSQRRPSGRRYELSSHHGLNGGSNGKFLL